MKLKTKYIIEGWSVAAAGIVILPWLLEYRQGKLALLAEGYPVWFYNFCFSFELLIITIICPGIIFLLVHKKCFKFLYAFVAIVICLATSYFFIMSNSVEGFYFPKYFCCMDEMPFKLKDNIIYDQDCGILEKRWVKRGEYEITPNGFLRLKISPLNARTSPVRETIDLKINFWGLYIPDDKRKDWKEYIPKDETVEMEKYVFSRMLSLGVFRLGAPQEVNDISKTGNVKNKFTQDKTADSTPATGTVKRLSSLSPLLGKDIQLYGISVVNSRKEKCLPYFLINRANFKSIGFCLLITFFCVSKPF